ncbi:hypothetical protein MMPV_010177 [Pyropia vietnamensis]
MTAVAEAAAAAAIAALERTRGEAAPGAADATEAEEAAVADGRGVGVAGVIGSLEASLRAHPAVVARAAGAERGAPSTVDAPEGGVVPSCGGRP